jgi:hypothetical protein
MLFLLVLLVAGLAIYMTGYRGVQNVFEHGVGVEFNSAKKVGAVQPHGALWVNDQPAGISPV